MDKFVAKFVVVKFTDEEKYCAVSELWLVKGKNSDLCHYPSEEDFPDTGKNKRPTLKELVKTHADSSEWSSYPCKIYRQKFDKYADAEEEVLRLLNEAITTADEEGIPEDKRPKELRRLRKTRGCPPNRYCQSEYEAPMSSQKTAQKTKDTVNTTLPAVPPPPISRREKSNGNGSVCAQSGTAVENPASSRNSNSPERRPEEGRSQSLQGHSVDSEQTSSSRSLRASKQSRSRTPPRRRSRARWSRRSRTQSLRRSRSRSSRRRRAQSLRRSRSPSSRRSRAQSLRRSKSQSSQRRSRSCARRSKSRSNSSDTTYLFSPASRQSRRAIIRSRSPSIQSRRRGASAGASVHCENSRRNDGYEEYLHNDVVFRRTMIQGLASTKAAVLKIAKRLACTDAPPDPALQIIAERLPVKSPSALKELDSDLKGDTTLYDKLVSYLCQSGGEDVTSATRTVLRKLLTDEVQVQYSWEGLKKKLPLERRETLIKAIFATVRRHFPNATERKMKTVITVDLRNAKQRIESKEKKKEKKMDIELSSEEEN